MPAVLETLDLGLRQPTTTDRIFDELYQRIITLDLPPGARMSEAEVSRALGVSRQPVRDAFWRLSKLGFLTVRPQRATTVSPSSPVRLVMPRSETSTHCVAFSAYSLRGVSTGSATIR